MKKNLLALVLMCCFISGRAQQKKEEFFFHNGTKAFFVTDEGKYGGVEDTLGKIIIPKVYGNISRMGNFIYCSERQGYNGKQNVALYDWNGKCLISEDEGYTKFKFFICNNSIFASSFTENGAPMVVFDGDGKCIYRYKELKNADGFRYLKNEIADTIVVEPNIYTGTFRLDGDVIMTTSENKKGVIKLNGEIIIPPLFAVIVPYGPDYMSEGFIVSTSKKNGMEGYFDKNGACIIPVKDYSFVRPFNGMFKVVQDGHVGLVDSLGKVQLMTKYQGLSLEKDEKGVQYYKTRIGNGYGKMTLKGKILEEPRPTIAKKMLYVPLHPEEDNYVQITGNNGLLGIETKDGKSILPCQYDYISFNKCSHSFDPYTPFFSLTKNGYQGIAREDGTLIIPCGKYHNVERVNDYGNDYYKVEYFGKYGLCDKDGKEIIAPLYDGIDLRKPLLGKDEKECIIVKQGSFEGALDFNGKQLIPFDFSKVMPERGTGNYEVTSFNKKGIYGKDGSIIIPIQYSRISITKNNTGPYNELYSVHDGQTEGLFTTDGKMLFPTGLYRSVYIKSGKEEGLDGITWCFLAYNSIGDNYYYDLNGEFLSHKNLINSLFETMKEVSEFVNYCSQASDEFDKKNYKKAIDFYNKALTVSKESSVYYNIGAAYFNMGKYKDAINSLRTCLSICKTQSTIDDATFLIEESELCMQKKRERRANVWLKIIGTAFNVGAAVIQYNYVIKNQNEQSHSRASFGGQYVRDTRYDYLLDPRVAMMQVQQQYFNEYLQMTNGGTSMSYEEWFQKIKGPALAEEWRIEHGLSSGNDSDSDETNSYQGELSPDQYEATYRRWEKLVQDWFNNLTSSGYKIQDEQGNIKGRTDGDMKGWAYVGNQSGLKRAQNEMRKIRLEAEKYGVHIQQSKWETATSSY